MEEEIEDLDSSIQDSKKVLEGGKPDSMKTMVKRMTVKLLAQHRIKKLGSGRKQLIDEEDERYLATRIVDKASAHGRRKDSTLYVSQRIKGFG